MEVKIAADWQEKSYGRTVAPGLGIYFLSPKEKDWEWGIIQRELCYLREMGLGGQAYFRSRFLTDNTKGIYDYLQKKEETIVGEAVKNLSSQSSPSSPTNEPKAASTGAIDYAARKEQAKQQRKLQKRVEECEKKVAKIEAELKELEEWMATPTGAANQALFEQYAQLKNTLAEAEAEWEEAMMALEE